MGMGWERETKCRVVGLGSQWLTLAGGAHGGHYRVDRAVPTQSCRLETETIGDT